MSATYDVVVVGLGALGSATCWQLARRGLAVLGLERFALGHPRGASHGASRILRRSYHTPAYVRLAGEAYDDWADLEDDAGTTLVTVTGGLDLFPPGAAIAIAGYRDALRAAGVACTELDHDGLARRWPQLSLPAGTRALHQAGTAIVPASRATAVLQRRARAHGAVLREHCRVDGIAETAGGVEVHAGGRRVRCGTVVLCADAWTNRLLAPLGLTLPLTVTAEQVTFYAVDDAGRHAPGALPVWIWMDDPSFYGFPCYGEATVKVAQDCGGPVVDPDTRTFTADAANRARVDAFVRATLPGAGPALRTSTCLYTLTPDRDFVLGAPPGHDRVLVGLGAAHGFKFAPTLGRLLAALATGERDAAPAAFAVDRPALHGAGRPARWLV